MKKASHEAALLQAKPILSCFPILETRNIEQWTNLLDRDFNLKHETLNSKYFFSSLYSLPLREVTLSNIRIESKHSVKFSLEQNITTLSITLSGFSTVSFSKHKIDCCSKTNSILYNEQHGKYEALSEGYENLLISLPSSYLSNISNMYFGDCSKNICFDNKIDMSKSRAKLFRDTVISLSLAANNNTCIATMPGLAIAYQEFIAKGMILSLPNNASPLLLKTPKQIAPKTVKIAEAFIEANLSKTIRMKDLVRITNTPLRSLQASFKNHRGYTPSEFLQECRLSHARKLLLDTSQNRTVMEISLQCGFSSHSRLSSFYKKKFGEYPSETLKSARSK